ncbi:HAMP domain-containing sensor histidine kinase [Methylosinus sp. C49]|uniref:sensor histidine kinase n=1 Tax=Methylosinus sp. C49 TaxID=2699395 RepID=UPI001FCE38E8|nr:HAMP domain-containing sensor histidine kinase [Methylosinus sp. C49]
MAEVNSLLEAKAKAVESAKARAANLAHALKTPLAILATDAERLRKDGRDEIADELQELAFGMRRHINGELSRARLQSLAGSPVQATSLRNVVESLTRAFMRTPRGGALSWRLDIPADVTIGMGVEEATELFGALLENAVKWAATEVHVSAERERVLSILDDDDGPGVPPEKLVELGQPGVRLDEKTEGTGLGLSISSDIVDAYGGQIRFGTRSPHGFQAIITLPA